MKTISFAWTTAALVNGRKTETRRVWKPEYAARFRKGDRIVGYDRQPQFGGNQVALCELTENPYPDYTRHYDKMTAYEAEGFGFYDEHPELMPKKWKEDFAAAGIANFVEYWEFDFAENEFAADEYERTGKVPTIFYWVVQFRVVNLLHPESDRYLLKNLLKEVKK